MCNLLESLNTYPQSKNITWMVLDCLRDKSLTTHHVGYQVGKRNCSFDGRKFIDQTGSKRGRSKTFSRCYHLLSSRCTSITCYCYRTLYPLSVAKYRLKFSYQVITVQTQTQKYLFSIISLMWLCTIFQNSGLWDFTCILLSNRNTTTRGVGPPHIHINQSFTDTNPTFLHVVQT